MRKFRYYTEITNETSHNTSHMTDGIQSTGRNRMRHLTFEALGRNHMHQMVISDTTLDHGQK